MEQTDVEQTPSVSEPQVNQTQQAPPQSTSSSPKKKPLIIVGVLLGFVLFGIGGYMLGTQRANQSSKVDSNIAVPSQSPTSSPTVTETPDVTITAQPTSILLPTNDWREINNSVISLKYPEDEYIPQTSDSSIYFKSYVDSGGGQQTCNCPNIMIADNYNGGSRRQWWLDYYSYAPEEINNVSFTEKVIGGKQVLIVKLKHESSPREILYSKDNTLVDVMIQGADMGTVESMVATLKVL